MRGGMYFHTSFLILLFIQLVICIPTDNVALVVSAAPYHYETAAFFAYHLRNMNLDVHVWLHQYGKAAFGGVGDLVFANYTKNIQYIGKNMWSLVPPKIKLLVYVTMNTEQEVKALCPLNRLHEHLYDLAEKVIMVNHQSAGYKNVYQYCQLPKCTIFHLGAHVDLATRDSLRSTGRLLAQTVAVQPIYEPPFASDLRYNIIAALESATNQTRFVAVQGTMVKYRRNYDEFFQCIESIRSEGIDLRIFLLGSQSKKLSIPSHFSNFVTLLRGDTHPQYYATIAHSHFVAMFANPEMRYDSDRASSTVPTAIISGVPVILPSSMLGLYSCLATSPMHASIAGATDCESLRAAARLSWEELAALRAEAQRCRSVWLREGEQVLSQMVSSSSDVEGAASPVSGSVPVSVLGSVSASAGAAGVACCGCAADVSGDAGKASVGGSKGLHRGGGRGQMRRGHVRRTHGGSGYQVI